MKKLVVILILSLFTCSFFSCGEEPSKDNFRELTNFMEPAIVQKIIDFDDEELIYVEVRKVNSELKFFAVASKRDSLYIGSIVKLYSIGERGIFESKRKVYFTYIARKDLRF